MCYAIVVARVQDSCAHRMFVVGRDFHFSFFFLQLPAPNTAAAERRDDLLKHAVLVAAGALVIVCLVVSLG